MLSLANHQVDGAENGDLWLMELICFNCTWHVNSNLSTTLIMNRLPAHSVLFLGGRATTNLNAITKIALKAAIADFVMPFFDLHDRN